jgi:hypothetical protein
MFTQAASRSSIKRARDRCGVSIGTERGEDDRNGRGRRLSHGFFLYFLIASAT